MEINVRSLFQNLHINLTDIVRLRKLAYAFEMFLPSFAITGLGQAESTFVNAIAMMPNCLSVKSLKCEFSYFFIIHI